jgi:hypothetical protein
VAAAGDALLPGRAVAASPSRASQEGRHGRIRVGLVKMLLLLRAQGLLHAWTLLLAFAWSACARSACRFADGAQVRVLLPLLARSSRAPANGAAAVHVRIRMQRAHTGRDGEEVRVAVDDVQGGLRLYRARRLQALLEM